MYLTQLCARSCSDICESFNVNPPEAELLSNHSKELHFCFNRCWQNQRFQRMNRSPKETSVREVFNYCTLNRLCKPEFLFLSLFLIGEFKTMNCKRFCKVSEKHCIQFHSVSGKEPHCDDTLQPFAEPHHLFLHKAKKIKICVCRAIRMIL